MKGSDLSFGVVGSQSPPSVTFDAGEVDLSSPDFPDAKGTLKNLHIDDSGFSLDEGVVTGPAIKLGKALEIDGLTIDAQGLSYSSSDGALMGKVGIAATGVKLFPDSSTFRSNVTGFSASYDIQTQAVSLALGHADLTVGDVLEVAADKVSFTDDAGNVEIKVGTASATIPRLAGLKGTVTNLDITNDGFTVDSARLDVTGDVKLGIFDFTGLYAEATSFGYSATSGGSFNGFLKIGAAKADLALKKAVTVDATGIDGKIASGGPHFGAFTFGAASIDATLGDALALSATGVQFDTAPAADEYIASIDSLGATLNVAGLSLSGGAQDFAIAADGSFVTRQGFGVHFGASGVDPGKFQWPTWLPIQIQNIGLRWPDFAADPTNFQIDLSASVNASIPDTQIGLSGFVQDAIIDVGLLKQGIFPIVGLSGAGIGASGDLFGAQFSAELFVAVLNLDKDFQIVADPTSPTIAHHIFYGGIDGSLDIEGLAGFEVRLGLSELGPLEGFVRDNQAEILEPISGLTISGFRGGITFGQSLPSITDPHQLATDPAFQSEDDLTLLQWKDKLARSVQGIAQKIGDSPVTPAGAFAALTQNMTITGGATLFSAYATEDAFRLDGDVLFDTTGKFAAHGNLTLGDSVQRPGLRLRRPLSDRQGDCQARRPGRLPRQPGPTPLGLRIGRVRLHRAASRRDRRPDHAAARHRPEPQRLVRRREGERHRPERLLLQRAVLGEAERHRAGRERDRPGGRLVRPEHRVRRLEQPRRPRRRLDAPRPGPDLGWHSGPSPSTRRARRSRSTRTGSRSRRAPPRPSRARAPTS